MWDVEPDSYPEVGSSADRIVEHAVERVRVVVIPGQQHVAMDLAPDTFVGAVTDFLEDRRPGIAPMADKQS